MAELRLVLFSSNSDMSDASTNVGRFVERIKDVVMSEKITV